MSSPPMVSVTTESSAASASNCGGLVPSGTDSGWVMLAVVAPVQVAST